MGTDYQYFDANEERDLVIAEANTETDAYGNFVDTRLSARRSSEATIVYVREITHIDISPKQLMSETTTLIPFLEHDDANRALMGSNMQRQAVSCVIPQAPIVGTGIEDKAARDSGQVVLALQAGDVIASDANHIVVRSKAPAGAKKDHIDTEYLLQSFEKSNAFTSMNQVPRVLKGQTVKEGDLLADGASTDHGELALGQNMVVAFVSWEGFSYEDAIVVSERIDRKSVV